MNRFVTGTCPRCGFFTAAHSLKAHRSGKRCPARQLYNKLVADGKYVADPNAGRIGNLVEALKLFGFPCVIMPTRTSTGDGMDEHDLPSLGNHVWTSLDGASTISLIDAAARLLNLTFPEAARRLKAHEELIGPFGTARALGAEQDALLGLLSPICYGKDRNGVMWAVVPRE